MLGGRSWDEWIAQYSGSHQHPVNRREERAHRASASGSSTRMGVDSGNTGPPPATSTSAKQATNRRPRAGRGARKPSLNYGRPAPDSNPPDLKASPRAAGPPRAWTWAALMRRVFDLDVLVCPRCDGGLRVIAIVQDPLAGQAILAHLARSAAPAPPGPAPPAPAALT
jgi:hypothetical protein